MGPKNHDLTEFLVAPSDAATGNSVRSWFFGPMRYRLLAVFLYCLSHPIFGASVAVSGGIKTHAEVQPLLFTWTAPLPVSGAGWTAGESITIALHGPLNSPGVAAADLGLGTP